jgi:cyclase
MKKMKRCLTLLLLLLTVGSVSLLFSGEPSELIEVKKLGEKLYLFQYKSPYDYHHLLYTGEDRLLLIDTGYTETADELYSKVKKYGGDKPIYIVNTHAHFDHIQGNSKFKKEAVIISHLNTRNRFFPRYFSLPVMELAGPPDLVIEDRMIMYLDDQEVLIEHTPNGHTDGDLILYFPKENLLFAGDIIFPKAFPLAAVNMGGDPDGYLVTLKSVIEKYPDNTRFLATHGGFYNMDQLKNCYNRLSKSADIIKKELSKGMTVNQIMESDVLKEYNDWADGNLNLKRWWIAAFNTKHNNKILPVSINDPVTKALMDSGIEAAINKYDELRDKFPEKYNFAENQLNELGYELLNRNMVKEAIEMLKLNAEAYPNSSNVYDSLAEAYMTDKQTDLAIKYYQKSLELDPSNTNAKDLIEKLQGQEKK